MIEQEKLFYYKTVGTEPVEVRILLFNELFNLYEKDSNHFLKSFSIKGSELRRKGDYLTIHLKNSSEYLELKANNPLAEQIANEINYRNSSFGKRMLKNRVAMIIAVLLLLLGGLYFLLISLVPVIGAGMISTDTEISIGNKLKEMTVAQELAMGAKIDSSGTKKIQAFAGKLKLSERYPIRITVLESKTVNAYAMPGGQIVVYSGMLEKIKTPEALVALLSHESMHVNDRHTLKSLLKEASNSLVISILFNDPTGMSSVLIGNAESLYGLRYSRSLEKDADRKGMELMLQNGVDPEGMVQLMNILKNEGDMPASLEFLSTHPLTEDRIAEANKFISGNRRSFQKRSDLEQLFQLVKQRGN